MAPQPVRQNRDTRQQDTDYDRRQPSEVGKVSTCHFASRFLGHGLMVKEYRQSPAPTTTNWRPSSMKVIGALLGLSRSRACQSGLPLVGSNATKFPHPSLPN